MDYLAFTALGFAFSLFYCVFLSIKNSKERKFEASERLRLITQRDDAWNELERLKSLPPPEKKVLTIEAQQILHDMTVHGSAVVRIIPLNPNEIFYRSPS